MATEKLAPEAAVGSAIVFPADAPAVVNSSKKTGFATLLATDPVPSPTRETTKFPGKNGAAQTVLPITSAAADARMFEVRIFSPKLAKTDMTSGQRVDARRVEIILLTRRLSLQGGSRDFCQSRGFSLGKSGLAGYLLQFSQFAGIPFTISCGTSDTKPPTFSAALSRKRGRGKPIRIHRHGKAIPTGTFHRRRRSALCVDFLYELVGLGDAGFHLFDQAVNFLAQFHLGSL